MTFESSPKSASAAPDQPALAAPSAAPAASVFTWGRSKNFRCGRDALGRDSRAPEPVPSLVGRRVSRAACGGGHTCVVTREGQLFVFGYSQYGQLGLGDRTDTCAATRVELREDGGGGRGSAEGGEVVGDVCCGRYHSLAMTESGHVYTWGGGKNGRLGHGDEKIRLLPKCVEALRSERAVAIAAGYHNNLVLTAAGDVWSWGWGQHGQLGTGDTRDREAPVVVEGLGGMGVVQLACGDRTSFAVTADGRVLVWGSNEFGQGGAGVSGETLLSPVVVDALSGLVVVSISSGDRHTAAVTNVGSLYTWGCGVEGQLGHGDYRDVPRPRHVQALAHVSVVSVHCGHNFTMATTDKGVVYALGNNTYGQLGNNGSPGKSALPVRVIVPESLQVSLISCAHFHCVMVAEGAAGGAADNDGVGMTGNTFDAEAAVGFRAGEDSTNDEDFGRNKSGMYDELAAADVRLREALERYSKRKSKSNAGTAEQSRELVIADILRLSSSPAATTGSSPSSSVSS